MPKIFISFYRICGYTCIYYLLFGCSGSPIQIEKDHTSTLWCETRGGVRECHYINDRQAQESIEQILRGY